MFRFATLSQDEVLKDLSTSLDSGLSSAEAAQRLATHGPNEITANQVHWYDILLSQFKSAFIYLLIVAAVIVFAVGERLDAVVIVIFVLVNALLGFFQEYRSEQSLQALTKFINPRTRVRRDGRWNTVDSSLLVPGDIVNLQTGDAVTADVRVLSTHNLVVNETTLTGESVPVPKSAQALAQEPGSIYDSHNLCFSGTSVVEGDGVAVVLETGSRTRMGTIAKLTVETTKESEFSKSINRFSNFILRLILITLVVTVAANLLLKGSDAHVVELLVFAIALVVSVIPEALPVVTTVSLSHGALQLAKRGVVVKRLTAIEDIGSIEVLCSDKTGTLTENSLDVSGTSPGAHPDLLYCASLTVGETEDKTEPFDIAIAKAAFTTGLDMASRPRRLAGPSPLRSGDGQRAPERRPERLAEIPFDPHRRPTPLRFGDDVKRIAEIPFDPVRRRNAVLVKGEGDNLLVVRRRT